jgi:branched-chain amino acid transport system substrate-binding protein
MRKALLAAVTVALAATAAAFGGNATPAKKQAAAGPDSADRALIRCGRTRTMGVAAPITGAAASIGSQQLRWARFYVTRYNASHRRTKFRLVQGDTQLPDTAQAIRVAENFASRSAMLGMVGPAGSQEVQVSTAVLKRSGMGFVSGSATRTSLTVDGNRRGYFFRVVPNDDQQGPKVARHIRSVLRATRVVVIDGQDAYSQGLSDTVQRILRGVGGITVQRESVNPDTTSDFSSLVARIPSNTQVVYIPWQLAPKAQLFGQQLRAAGKSARLFGSDGLFDPDNFKIPGSLVSFFPINLSSPLIAAYRRGPGRGQRELFGLPSFQAAAVVGQAIDRACRNGTATRAEVRRQIAATNIPRRTSLLGFNIRFVSRIQFPLGPGDMRTPADFGIYQIQANGSYTRIA